MNVCIDKNCGGTAIKKGFFSRFCSTQPVQRYHCKACKKNFSAASFHRTYRQHKRHLNSKVRMLLVSNVSQRRTARILGTTTTTVARKLKWLGMWARVDHAKFIKKLPTFPEIQFDEVESFEHSKCKPLSVPLAVSKKERYILAYSVCSMPAKGLLAKISRKKYGHRKDERREHLLKVLGTLKPFLDEETKLVSDKCPRYPPLVRQIFPEAVHVTHKGRRGAVVGQGELKKIGRDPLFSLNHSAAMLRANIARLIRKTWVTTKKPCALLDHISIYVHFHNTKLFA